MKRNWQIGKKRKEREAGKVKRGEEKKKAGLRIRNARVRTPRYSRSRARLESGSVLDRPFLASVDEEPPRIRNYVIPAARPAARRGATSSAVVRSFVCSFVSFVRYAHSASARQCCPSARCPRRGRRIRSFIDVSVYGLCSREVTHTLVAHVTRHLCASAARRVPPREIASHVRALADDSAR